MDITLNDDDGFKCKQSLETVVIDLTKFKRSVAVLKSKLMSHNTEESENTPESPVSWGD